MIEEDERRALSAVQDALRIRTNCNRQLAKFSRPELYQETVTKSLEDLQSKLEGELTRVRPIIEAAYDVSSFMAKISASLKVGHHFEAVDVMRRIDMLRNAIDPISDLTGPFVDDAHALSEGLRVISDDDDRL